MSMTKLFPKSIKGERKAVENISHWFISWSAFMYCAVFMLISAVLFCDGFIRMDNKHRSAFLMMALFYGCLLCSFRFVRIQRSEITQYSFFGLRKKRLSMDTFKSAHGVMSRVNPVTGKSAFGGNVHPYLYVINREGKALDLTIPGNTYLNRKLLGYIRAYLNSPPSDKSEGVSFPLGDKWDKKWSFAEWDWFIWGPLFYLIVFFI